MKRRDWGRHETCVRCRINNKTLAKILDGRIPRRIDALYRLVDGLQITMEEALGNATAYNQTQRPQLNVVPGGRRGQPVAQDKK